MIAPGCREKREVAAISRCGEAIAARSTALSPVCAMGFTSPPVAPCPRSRICTQAGHFRPGVRVDDAFLVQLILSFRLACPDLPLVLSTRESPRFRDGMAGLGICRMSVASRTTVGGYAHAPPEDEATQFEVTDTRDVTSVCAALRNKGLEPVFKNWDATFRTP